jgi:hypothetical protein
LEGLLEMRHGDSFIAFRWSDETISK